MPVASISSNGPTTFCQGSNVVLTSSVGTSYLWSSGETTPSITVSTSGSYSVTLTDGNGCSSVSSPELITVNPLPVSQISGNTTICQGSTTTLTASAGTSYLWSTGDTTQAITVGILGNYSVTVTDANACSQLSSVTNIVVNPLPVSTISANGPTTFCIGDSVVLTSSPGTSYLWSNGETTASITVSTVSDNYSVTVFDGSGCSTISATTQVTLLPFAATITAGGPTSFCQGILSANLGTSYLWNTGETTQTIDASTQGSYYVMVGNSIGCIATSNPTLVTNNQLPSVSISTSGSTTICQGNNVSLTASAGASYSWSTGETTQSITVSTSGSYSVTLTDGNGCSSVSSPELITVNPLPVSQISGNTTICQGSTTTLTASAGTSYLWSTGDTTQAITVGILGNYSVTVTDANACSQLSSVTNIVVNPLPVSTISANGPTTFCIGDSVVLTSNPGTSYLWSNGETTQTVNVSTSGTYTVAVTGSNGCVSNANSLVSVNANPAVLITCAGSGSTVCSGTTLTASGATTYLWNNGETTTSINVLTPGTYFVTGTDLNGCSAFAQPVVINTVNPLPAPTISASGPTTFFLGGNVVLTSSAGTSYLWSSGETTQSITVSTSGSYSVTLTDGNGCSSTSAATAVVNLMTIPLTNLKGRSCGMTFTTLLSSVWCVAVPNATNYEYEFTNAAIGYSATVRRGGNFTNYFLYNIPTIRYGYSYTVRVRAYVNGFWGSFGSPCTITLPAVPTTKLSNASCNAIVATLKDNITCNQVKTGTVVASKYEYRFTNSALNYSATALRNDKKTFLSLSAVSGLKLGTTYYVKVRAFVNGDWGVFGDSCTIFIPVPLTTLTTASCGLTVASMSSAINCIPVLSATDYQYEFTNDTAGFSATVKRGGNFSNIFLSKVPGLRYGYNYNVRVRSYVNNSWTNWGNPCPIYLPPFPTTTLNVASCNSTTILASSIGCNLIPGATNYNYEFTTQNTSAVSNQNTSTVINKERGSSSTSLELKTVSGLQAGVTYTVKVRGFVGGVWGPYGSDCNLTIGSGSRIMNSIQENQTQSRLSMVQLNPNPFNETFTVKTNGEQLILNVYDMLGKIVSTHNLFDDSETRIGNDLSAGIYTVEIIANNERRFIKMVKSR